MRKLLLENIFERMQFSERNTRRRSPLLETCKWKLTMRADKRLKLGGNADYIRPKYMESILRTFFI